MALVGDRTAQPGLGGRPGTPTGVYWKNAEVVNGSMLAVTGPSTSSRYGTARCTGRKCGIGPRAQASEFVALFGTSESLMPSTTRMLGRRVVPRTGNGSR